MTDSERSGMDLFRGARRAQRYQEADVDPVAAPAGVRLEDAQQPLRPSAAPADASHGSGLGSDAQVLGEPAGASAAQPGNLPPASIQIAPVPSPRPAQWGWRGRVQRGTGGLVKLAPEPAELAHREALTAIRRATWTRAVNVIVTSPKGGVGKTPTSLLLAGILGHVRGGYVAAWEAAEAPGTLNDRAEGDPTRGLAELLASVDNVHSAGSLGGYTAPQTSHADVIGSITGRAVLTADDVLAARRVLDTYYRITISDTGNNLDHEAYLAALHTADAAVLPCLVSIDALSGVEKTLRSMRDAGGQVAAPGGLLSRVVVVLGHDGGPEDPRIATALRARLDELGVAAVVEVPFDPAIRLGGAITLGSLSEKSTRAWTAAAAAVVETLRTAHTETDLVQQLRDAMTNSRQG